MLSFIVPAYNEERLLGSSLAAIHRAAAATGEPYEVIVVDDGSTDQTSAVAEASNARVVRVAHRQIAATRNSGAKVAIGDLFVFVDSDTTVNAEVIQAAIAAVRAGATLVEEAPVARAVFSAAQGVWKIHCRPKHPQVYQARVVVAADGASSALARSLGVVTTFPGAVCSRAYVAAGTSSFDMDGLVFYPPTLLPGYCALLREAGDEINFSGYNGIC